ncbi:hypothetical protein [Georgenia thermotolerans]|uniref:hypothetical protein n=1 Tax=Georgenia thermotolerans TaxID=527326 RepID=UPI0012659A4B|nr:hypothetical protein [Georgenia thermotolerans]
MTVAQMLSAGSLTSPALTTTEPALLMRALTDLNDGVNTDAGYPSSATVGRAQSHPVDDSGNWQATAAVAHSDEPTPGAKASAAWTLSASWTPRAWTLALTAPDPAPSGNVARWWNGTTETPASVTRWDGTQEQPVTLEIA